LPSPLFRTAVRLDYTWVYRAISSRAPSIFIAKDEVIVRAVDRHLAHRLVQADVLLWASWRHHFGPGFVSRSSRAGLGWRIDIVLHGENVRVVMWTSGRRARR